VPGQGEPAVYGEAQSVLRMVPDERLNALIVVATEGLMEQVRYLINQLDQATPYEANTIRVKRLLNADAEAVEEVLSAITGGPPRAAAGGGGAQGGGGGAQAAGEVQTFEKKITISRFEQTNSLVIVASPQDYKTLEPIIDQLDVPRRQVNVEAVIMEVTINDAFELSVETAGLTANSAFALNNIANLARGIAGGPLAVGGPGTTFGIIDGTTQIPLPGPANPDTGLPGAVSLVTIPNVPLLMRTLETITNVEVLSQPNIMTLDNEEGNMTIGQEVPIIDTLADVNDRTGFNSRARVNRKDVGVIMAVTPQINEGDYVAMKVSVEVSSPVLSSVGIDPNEVGATFQKAKVEANVVIPDGKTGIIGGLLREGVDKSVNQAPVLGDLPLVGFLFRAKKNARNKQNVVILIMPHIVKEGHDLDRLTDYHVDEFYDRNIDAVFSKDGFIQKLKKKHQARNDNRPTDRFNPESDRYIERDMDQSSEKRKNFGRGDIDR
ncbi:MAG: secretin N-terminal domain-containing protein, partial [Candidatus Hydrogenedentota bacterium]